MGTQPEVIRLSKLVHNRQNYDYELNKTFFDELGLCAIDFYLGVAGENLGQTMGNVLA